MYNKFLQKFESILTLLTGYLFLAVLLITASNIMLRNVLGVSWLFMNGLQRLLFIWMVFTGTSVLYYRNEHLMMDFFSGKFSKKMARFIDTTQNIMFIVFVVILIIYGIQITRVRMTIPFETWDFPTGYAYMAVPVNAVVMGLFCVEKLIKTIGGGEDHA
jgi:TRAP-type C4-dicarboxylate transport system permease small subunit